jgi:tetratricopeptide (TPR) repeat protein
MTNLRRALVVAITLAAGPAFAADPCTDPANAAKANDALAKARTQKYADAVTSADAILAACPTHAVATQALGNALVGQKLYDVVITRMTTSIVAKPDQAYAYLWRGYGYYYKKQPDKMVGDFQTFLRLAPAAPEGAAIRQLLAGLAH